MDKKDKEFAYTYSAPTKSEREEIEDIRKSYLPSPFSNEKLLRLKTLDAKVKNTPTIWALILGIVGVLIFGLGLTMVLEWKVIVWGIIVSITGVVPMAIAYPIYKKLKEKLTNKHREEILKLSEELLNEEK